jgi:hypothetical protein
VLRLGGVLKGNVGRADTMDVSVMITNLDCIGLDVADAASHGTVLVVPCFR